MGSRWIWGIIILAIVSLLASLIGPWNAKSRSAQMGASIESALSSAGYDFVNVDMSGNVATLTGEAASDEAMAMAADLAANTECETCEKKGKIWHVVKNSMTVNQVAALPSVSPFVFNATKGSDGGLLVDGYVTSEAERERVLTEANALFPGKVVDNKVAVASGAPADGWGDLIARSLGYLAALDQGSVALNDSQMLLKGVAADASIRDRINAEIEASSGDYNDAANIRVPDAEIVNAGEVRSESLCQTLFDSLKGDTKINFAVDAADIRGAPSYDLLNTLASAANQCSSFRVRIEGHTDSDGDDAYNDYLSQARADEVVKYLASSGVEQSRLTSVGYGEKRPVATNDTPEGKAANRRIEFIVTTSE